MKLHLDLSRCVRAKSKFASCMQCVEASPKHLGMVEGLPSFAKGTGVEAAACVGACPTEALSLSDFSVTEFFFTFLESKVRLLSPTLNLPSLLVLSVEHLIALAVASEEPIVLDLHYYAKDRVGLEQMEERIAEANYLLSSFCDKRLESNHTEATTPQVVEDMVASRRAFLGSASLTGALKQKRAFEEAVEAEEPHAFEIAQEMIANIKERHLPDKRKILLTTLTRAKQPEVLEVLPQEAVGFISQKFVTASCTNCQICYRICPTGALHSDGNFSLIAFDAMLCVKCHLCHDVCEPDAIGLQGGFEIAEFFEPRERTLVAFDIRRCEECGNPFTYHEGEQSCPRCRIEEEEAMALHQTPQPYTKYHEVTR